MKHLKSQVESEKAVGSTNGVLNNKGLDCAVSPQKRHNVENENLSSNTLGHICPVCKQWFLTRRGLNSHTGRFHKGAPYEQVRGGE